MFCTPRLSHSLRRLEPRTDPPARTVRFTYDPAGRVLTQTLPDLRACPPLVEGEIRTTYDPNRNVMRC